MSQITIQNLHFTYDGDHTPVFEGLELQLDTNWKLGLVGRNGRGKTTLLRLLAGELAGQGTVSLRQPCLRWPKPVADPDRQTLDILLEGVPPEDEWKIYRELSLLGLSKEILDRPFSTLSGGEQTRALLAALFLDEGAYPMIDEPTNHLDGPGRALVADYLKNLDRGFLLVSHDRAFLDGCVDHVMALNRTGVEVQSGNFSSWWENKRRRDEFEQARNEHLQKEVGRLRQAAAQTSRWSDQVEATKKGTRTGGLRPDRGYIGHKSAKMMQRAKSIEDRRQRALEEKAGLLKDLERAEALKLRPLTARGRLLDARELSLFYGERRVCGPLDFRLEPGRRIALDGGNGCGKSTLLKFLLGEEIASQGTLVKLSGLTVSYVPQDTSHLRGRLRDYIRRTGAEEPLLLAILRKLDFPREQFEKNMEDWSAGQRKKVLIARSLCESAHLYIWDEPLNYIDVWSRMQIEELLLAFQPTMLFVEHDETFRQGVATETITIPCG